MQVVKNTMRGKDYGDAIENATERAMNAIGVFLEQEVINRAASIRDTGRYLGSITFATKKNRSHTRSPYNKPGDEVSEPRNKGEVHIGTNVEYGPHWEYGTIKLTAQPHFRPALNDNRKRVRELEREEIHKGLKRGK